MKLDAIVKLRINRDGSPRLPAFPQMGDTRPQQISRPPILRSPSLVICHRAQISSSTHHLVTGIRTRSIIDYFAVFHGFFPGIQCLVSISFDD